MDKTRKIMLSLMFSVVLTLQVFPMAFAHHNDDAGKNARAKEMEKSESINNAKTELARKVKDAFNEYRSAFQDWKSAIKNYRDTLISGTSSEIETAKDAVDDAETTKNDKQDEYETLRQEYRKKYQ